MLCSCSYPRLSRLALADRVVVHAAGAPEALGFGAPARGRLSATRPGPSPTSGRPVLRMASAWFTLAGPTPSGSRDFRALPGSGSLGWRVATSLSGQAKSGPLWTGQKRPVNRPRVAGDRIA